MRQLITVIFSGVSAGISADSQQTLKEAAEKIINDDYAGGLDAPSEGFPQTKSLPVYVLEMVLNVPTAVE